MSNNEHTVLITGGTRGIGRAVALNLAKVYQGRMWLNFLHNETEAERTRSMVESEGAKAEVIKANMAFEEDIERMCSEVAGSTSKLDCIVHCAALTNFRQPMDLKPRHLDRVLHMNVTPLLTIVQQLKPLLHSGSTIVAISSLGSIRVVPYYTAMGVAKAGLEALVRYLAQDLAPLGVRVNAVSGGLMANESLTMIPGIHEMSQAIEARTPMGRLGTPEEIADIVEFLVSPRSSWIVGQTLIADGGFSLA
jgi:enoyl-[acyl-carrier protein] reductase III